MIKFQNIFIILSKKYHILHPHFLPLSPKPQATTNLVSVSMDLLILDTS